MTTIRATMWRRPGATFGWLVMCLLTVTEVVAQAPNRWRWAEPMPHGANIYDMIVADGIAVQVGERGQLYTSDDLANWVPRRTGVTNSLRGAAFHGERLLVSGQAGTILWADSLQDIQATNLDTSDWLEAIASNGDLAVAVGDNGAIYSSPNGTNWTRETAPSATWLRGVATSGSAFVAVGENGFIITRRNDGSWSQQDSGTSAHLNRIAYTGQEFRVVGNRGTVLAGNAAGKSWNAAAELNITNNLYTVAGTNDTTLVAGREAVWLSVDGVWHDQTDPAKPRPAPVWTYNAAIWDEPLFFLAGRTGLGVEGFTTNGTDHIWVNRSQSLRIWYWDLLRLPDFYVGVGDRGALISSEDGVTWNIEATPAAATNNVLLGVAGDTNGLVAVGNRGTLLHSPHVATNLVFTNVIDGLTNHSTNTSSLLGIEWHARDTTVTNDLMAVATDGSRWVAAGGEGVVLSSDDGVKWTRQTSPTSAFLSGAVAWPLGFVITGDAGTILTSPDGREWTSRDSGVTNWIFRAAYSAHRLVAVGEGGLLSASEDGITWTRLVSPSTEWLYGIGTNDHGVFATGARGTLLVSTNTTDWTLLTPPTRKHLYGVAATPTQIIAIGVEGIILRGILRETDNPIRLLDYGRAAGQSLISVAGQTDQRFILDSSTNLTDWTEGVTYELSDRSGTMLILKAPTTNDLEFIRGRLLR